MHSPDSSLFQQELLQGARNAATCLAIGKRDRVTIISDHDTRRIGSALLAECRRAGAEVEVVWLEDHGARPFTSLPDSLAVALRTAHPTATFFAARGLEGEISFRIPLRHLLVDELRVRHAHMIDIDERLMVQGMLADYRVVARVVERITDLVRTAREIHVTNPLGTDFRATFSRDLRWKPCTGIYHHQGESGNLPEGETFTCPEDADGVLVVQVLGDYFSRKYGVLDRPVTFKVAHGRVVDVVADDEALRDELRRYLSSDESSDRVGEFAIGANLWVKALTGNLLQDEKIPGVHVAFGDPYPEETGANWSARTHVDVIPIDCTILVDERVLMRDGRFAPDVLAGIEGLPD